MSTRNFKRNFFIVAGADAVKRIAEWIKQKFYTKAEIDDMLSAGMKYKVVNELPATGEVGTFYLVPKQSAGTGDVYDEYIYVDGSYEHIGSTEIDLSNYYTKTQADDLLDDKVDKVNGKGLSTNDYTTTEKNKLSSIENGAEVNVQSDWNQTNTSADDFIKNKPSVYTKSEADNLLDDKVDKVSGKGLSTEDFTTAEKTKLGGIEAGAEVNVQSDWNQSDSTKDDYIKNKPTLRQPSADGTAGQYLKSNGSGNAPSWETMDSAPTDNSTKAVTSGGVKTALDGKQASVTITANANTPTDNDTVIMQDNGNTGTTSFLRRKLSTLWTYIKGKADEFYFARYDFANFPNDSFLGQKRYFQFFDDRLWGADQRFNVTWNTYDSETHENLNYTHTVANLFNHNFDNYHAHPQTGEYDVIRIYPKTEGGTLGWSYGTGWLFIFFYYISYPEVSPIVRIYGGRSGQKSWTTLPEPTKVTAQVFKYSLSQQDPALYLEEIEITITGKTFPNESSAKGCGVSNICYIPNRAPIADSAIVTKYGVTQSFYGNIIAPKFQTRGGTSSQYLRGDGSLTALSTTPTSGSTIPITSGGVYSNTQSKLSINIPDNSGYQVMQLIADVTTSLTTPNYNIAGLVGYLYQWRYGGTGRIAHRITAIGGHDVDNIFLFTDNNASNGAILPYLIKYNDKYYIALKKGSSSRSGIRLLGYWNGLLSEPINLYANSTASKWYSDSERTQEITFEITKSFGRYPNSYLNFGGTTSQVVTGTGELKTIDSSVASGSSNLVTSGAVYAAINGIDTSGKVNLQPDFTASQIDYSAGNVGKWQKVLRFPEGADLVINMKKTAMGSDSTSTLWFSSSSMGDSYTSLFGNHSVRFVHDGGYVFLVLACRKSTYEPIESYTFQIAHSSVPMSDIVAVTEASPITATPKEPSIVYRAPITTGAVSFNVNSSGAGSVAMANHNDFLGNMTSEATNGVTVTMSGATEGQIYRFVFTRNITGGVTFKQSNVAYCTISGDVNAGDTITLTAVSNTADGWLYEQESAGIESSDGSINIDYTSGIPDVAVNWLKLPRKVVLNNYDNINADPHQQLALGDGAQVDSSYTSNAIAIGKDSTARYSKALAIGYNASSSSTNAIAIGYRADSSSQYSIAIGSQSSASDSWAIAIGNSAIASKRSSIAIGVLAQSKKNNSIAIGNVSDSEGSGSIAIGSSADAYCDECITIGTNAKANSNNGGIAIGYYSDARGYDSIAFGDNSTSDGDSAISLGRYSSSSAPQSIALGQNAGVCERVIVNNVYRYCRMKPFNLLKFSVNGTDKFFNRGTGQVTITYEGNNYTINVANNTMFLTSDTEAGNIYSFVSGIFIDSTYYNALSGVSTVTINVYPLYEGSNVYVVDCGMGLANTDTSTATSAYFYATYLVSSASGFRGDAIGKEAKSYSGLAFGEGTISMVGTQTVLGTYNVPSSTDYFQVGIGSTYVNRRNVLTIDGNERLKVCSYVGETQTIEMNNQTGSLNINKAVFRIKWNGTGEVTLTLNTSGCVEGQRVTIFAETNDVKLFAQPYIIRQGRFCDFMFIGGAWRPSMGIEELVS